MDAVTRTPVPVNEPVKQYQPGSHERAVLEGKIKELAGQRAELTMTIGGRQQMATGEPIDVIQPHNKTHILGQLGNATSVDVAAAIYAAGRWPSTTGPPFSSRRPTCWPGPGAPR